MKTYLICGLFKGTDLIVAKRFYSREEAEEYIQGHEIYLQGYPMYIIESTECMKGGLKCTN